VNSVDEKGDRDIHNKSRAGEGISNERMCNQDDAREPQRDKLEYNLGRASSSETIVTQRIT